jgi:hypothetical protein
MQRRPGIPCLEPALSPEAWAAGDGGSLADFQIIFCEYAVVNTGSSFRYNQGAN